ncbi:hypothetical protein LCGC14_0225320 [marine sediment metagenome]|uniref:DUF2997 domain-containing protein n=1 Tax=marine sediment metagenome TaxID=412755 RepID=A0A0F9XG97_9ZZZZ
MKEMIIDIDNEGNMRIEVNGVKSDKCLKETKELEDKLGVVTKRDKKPDFYAKIRQTDTQRVKR